MRCAHQIRARFSVDCFVKTHWEICIVLSAGCERLLAYLRAETWLSRVEPATISILANVVAPTMATCIGCSGCPSADSAIMT